MMQYCMFGNKFQPSVNRIYYKIAVLDVDGTITDDRHRKHLLPDFKTDNPADYKKYQAACVGDMVLTALQGRISQRNYDAYIIATSRQSLYLMLTLSQLNENIFSKVIWIGMRGENDKSRSSDIKNNTIDAALKGILEIQPNAEFWVDIYDDRKEVLSHIKFSVKNVNSFSKFLVANYDTIMEL